MTTKEKIEDLLDRRQCIDSELRKLQGSNLVETHGARIGDCIEIICNYHKSLRGKILKVTRILTSVDDAAYVIVPKNKDGSWSKKDQRIYHTKETKINVIKD